MFRDEGSHLAEWIEYHRLVGVSHFWLYDNDSVDDGREVLAPYVAMGIVDLFSWPNNAVVGDVLSVRRARQLDAVRDGITRSRGKVEWIAHVDVDEFLLPMRNKSVPQCLERHFAQASGVYVNWRMFGTSGVEIPRGQPLLAKLTECSRRSHPENGNGKSLVRPETVAIDEIWYLHHFPLQNGKYQSGDGKELSFDDHKDLIKTKHHLDDYIRINHYNLRDEHFYRTHRLQAARQGQLNKSLERLLEHYDSFGKKRDTKIIEFLREYHREGYRKFWKAGG